MDIKRKRQYKSGRQKRLLQAKNEENRKKLKQSMDNYLLKETTEIQSEIEKHVDVVTPDDRVNSNVSSSEILFSNTDTDICDEIVTQQQNKDICVPREESSASEFEITNNDNTENVTAATENVQANVESPLCTISEEFKTCTFSSDNINNASGSCISLSAEIDSGCPCPSTSMDFLSLNFNDPALWPPVTDTLREYFIFNKPSQNIDALETSKQTLGGKERMCCVTNFFREKKNKEKVLRDWLIFSPSTKSLFCYICKLFSSSEQALSKSGFSDWRNVGKRLSQHETSPTHRESVYYFSQRSSVLGRVDSSLVAQHMEECNYWKQVLHRVVAVVKYISQRGLPFFGANETFGSVHNDNFLGILEVISMFDPFLAKHISDYGNKGKGKVSYFSSTIVSEFIEIMSKKVLGEIIKEIKQAKYFGIIVDSTPDITHTDQLSLVVRYVDSEGNPVERFLKFIPIHGHKSQHLHEVVINTLKDLGIDLKYCRGQSYDNASNMAGKYSGLQARLKKDFPLIEYVPCAAHSLNLVGVNAAECCPSAVSFFGLIQSLYNFFSASTHRWELLNTKIKNKLTLKSLSATRWSANADAVKVMKKNYSDILDILSIISKDVNESASTRSDATKLLSKMQSFEFALMVVVWDTILQRMNNVNKTLQSVNCEMATVVPLYVSLENFIKNVRNNFETYEDEAEKLAGSKNYESKRKRSTPKSKMLDDSASASVEVQWSARDRFLYKTHYVICDSIITELNKRKNAYAQMESIFGFMLPKNMTREEIQSAAKHFHEIYSDDIDEEFPQEFLQFNDFLSKDLTVEERLKMIKSSGIGHTFPNVETALRIMLSIPITNCSSERSFSVLKRIMNRLRSSISEKNLSGLSLLSIESDLTEKISFDDVIEQFALLKSRKMPM